MEIVLEREGRRGEKKKKRKRAFWSYWGRAYGTSVSGLVINCTEEERSKKDYSLSWNRKYWDFFFFFWTHQDQQYIWNKKKGRIKSLKLNLVEENLKFPSTQIVRLYQSMDCQPAKSKRKSSQRKDREKVKKRTRLKFFFLRWPVLFYIVICKEKKVKELWREKDNISISMKLLGKTHSEQKGVDRT